MKAVVLILHAFRDLIIRYLPRMKKKGGFAFIVHPRNLPDVYRKYPFLKFLSEPKLKWFLSHYWPVVLSEVEGLKDKTGKKVRGWIIAVPLTPEQMLENRELANRKIVQSIKLAEKNGAQIVGLGALTASLTKGGLDLKNKVKAGITTGRAYTTKTVVLTVVSIAEKLGINLKKSTVAIVGAAGGIGSACTKILTARGVKNFILVDLKRKMSSMEDLIYEIQNEKVASDIVFKTSSSVHDVYPADIIIAATNTPDVVIGVHDLKPGAIVVNDAQPSDISTDVYKEREDVLVIEGGVINTPGIKYHFNFGLLDKEDTFCCLGEVMALASINYKKDYATGCLDISLIDDISKISENLNFRLAEFQNPIEGRISQIKINKIKDLIKNKY